jgi:hypothetical protein
MQRNHVIAAAAASVLAALLPTIASAQYGPPPAYGPPPMNGPHWNCTYAPDPRQCEVDHRFFEESGHRRFMGIVAGFYPYHLTLSNGLPVHLHHGTIINPTGLTPQPGMRVELMGHWNPDGSFTANEIDEVARGRY